MSDTERFFFGLVAAAALFFGLYTAAKEAGAYTISSKNSVTVEGRALQTGYTVMSTDGGLMVPVFPNQYKKPVTIAIERHEQMAPFPEHTRAISPVYTYQFSARTQGALKIPLTLAVQTADTTYRGDRSVYFFDTATKTWQSLPSAVDGTRHRVVTRTVMPTAEIVVLEDTNSANALTAKSAIVMDTSGAILFAKDIDTPRPIASLSKLVSATVFLKHNPGWEKMITITAADNVGGASCNFAVGDVVSVKNLFNAMLVGSKNNATRAIMRSTGLSEEAFVKEMNTLVKQWGLTKTSFVEPTGLDEHNVSTARELAIISQQAFKKKDIVTATTLSWYQVQSKRNGVNRSEWVKNTNKLLDRDVYVTGGKTGYTTEAGYNLITRAKNKKHELIVLVLGAKISQNYEEVYTLIKKYL